MYELLLLFSDAEFERSQSLQIKSLLMNLRTQTVVGRKRPLPSKAISRRNSGGRVKKKRPSLFPSSTSVLRKAKCRNSSRTPFMGMVKPEAASSSMDVLGRRSLTKITTNKSQQISSGTSTRRKSKRLQNVSLNVREITTNNTAIPSTRVLRSRNLNSTATLGTLPIATGSSSSQKIQNIKQQPKLNAKVRLRLAKDQDQIGKDKCRVPSRPTRKHERLLYGKQKVNSQLGTVKGDSTTISPVKTDSIEEKIEPGNPIQGQKSASPAKELCGTEVVAEESTEDEQEATESCIEEPCTVPNQNSVHFPPEDNINSSCSASSNLYNDTSHEDLASYEEFDFLPEEYYPNGSGFGLGGSGTSNFNSASSKSCDFMANLSGPVFSSSSSSMNMNMNNRTCFTNRSTSYQQQQHDSWSALSSTSTINCNDGSNTFPSTLQCFNSSETDNEESSSSSSSSVDSLVDNFYGACGLNVATANDNLHQSSSSYGYHPENSTSNNNGFSSSSNVEYNHFMPLASSGSMMNNNTNNSCMNQLGMQNVHYSPSSSENANSFSLLNNNVPLSTNTNSNFCFSTNNNTNTGNGILESNNQVFHSLQSSAVTSMTTITSSAYHNQHHYNTNTTQQQQQQQQPLMMTNCNSNFSDDNTTTITDNNNQQMYYYNSKFHLSCLN